MRNKRIYIIIILILFGYSVYETLLFYKMDDTCRKYKMFIENKKIENITKMANIDFYLDIIFNNYDSLNIYTKNLISKYNINNKLVFFFRQETCMKCILDVLWDIDSMILGVVPPEDIVLICQSLDENLFTNEVLKKYNERFRTIWISSDDYYKPLANKPYFFIANKNKSSKFFYIPELIPMYKEKYYYEVVPAHIH